MKDSYCSNDGLRALLDERLLPAESEEILEHIETCKKCQTTLDELAADDSWWERASKGLEGVATDENSKLLAIAGKSQYSATNVALSKLNEPAFNVEASDLFDPPVQADLLGRLDEFDILEKIGQGGMGVVFRAFDRSLNRPVAIKVLLPHLSCNSLARQRFAREAKAAAAVVSPHVVAIHRVSDDAKCPYIAMPYIDGQSLQQHIEINGPMAPREIVSVIAQIAEGLAVAHERGVIHRDVKPANVIKEKDVSRITITDFGLASAVDEMSMTHSGSLAGTPHYMSPEQIRGDAIGDRCDLFALGGVAYFLATGREPFRGANVYEVLNQITRDEPLSTRRFNCEVPESLDRIILRLLEKNPKDRFQSAHELSLVLNQFLAHLNAPSNHAEPNVSRPPSQQRKMLKSWGAVAAICTLAFLTAFGAYSFFYPSGQTRKTENHHSEAHEHSEHHGSEHDHEHK